MSKIIILGSGAAPGVPCLSQGFGACDPNNPKNFRMRAGTYMELSGVKFLIDTSPDIRTQLLTHNIRAVDAVFYTHAHADHLHGIDDMRELNRISGKPIDIYASEENMAFIRQRFSYLLADAQAEINPIYRAALLPHVFDYQKSFFAGNLEVTPIKLEGHNIPSSGYIFNQGEVVFIADFKTIDEAGIKMIKRQPKVMIMPLTTPDGTRFHAGFDDLMRYAAEIKPERLIINHMAVECDYEAIQTACKAAEMLHMAAEPAYDGLTIEF